MLANGAAIHYANAIIAFIGSIGLVALARLSTTFQFYRPPFCYLPINPDMGAPKPLLSPSILLYIFFV